MTSKLIEFLNGEILDLRQQRRALNDKLKEQEAEHDKLYMAACDKVREFGGKLEEAKATLLYYASPQSNGGCWDERKRCVGSMDDDDEQYWSRFAMGKRARAALEKLKE